MNGFVGLFGLIGLVGTAGLLSLRRKGRDVADPLANYPVARQPCLPNADVAHTPLMNPVITPEAAGLTPRMPAPRVPEPPRQYVPNHRVRTESRAPADAPAKTGTFEGRLNHPAVVDSSPTRSPVTGDRVTEDPVGEPEESPRRESVPVQRASEHAPAPTAAEGFLGGLITKASQFPQAASRLPRKLRRR
jgi:hypothetical protein